MKISIFLSYPKPFLKVQHMFVERISEYLDSRGIHLNYFDL